ncbi:glycogen synthase [Poriferisphaera corsica]|uniref:Glycogen synthase n=1 Tax=Poriferisphaera corsica TaxID=2528020 RepID=A0A517YZH2_9BACT|nr:glycosyltransferase [Poriferisphaera corsica]QDU35625.1 glycogen synthase [Poriferisphaera corsica]
MAKTEITSNESLKPTHKPRASKSRRAEPLLMEISWEVCNQLGGIYTVLRSKTPSMVTRWSNRYCLIGPYNHDKAQVEFEPAPLVGPIGQTVKQLRDMGIGAHYGRWLVSGRPNVVLLESDKAYQYLDKIKYRLYADHGISTDNTAEPLVDQVLTFAEVVRIFLQTLAEKESHRRDLIAHCHEWMAGPVIPMLRHENWPGALVFTTHATILGRYLAMNDHQFYDHLSFFDDDEEAKHFNIQAQHQLERAAAHGSHVFTTVSDVTAEECTHLLGRTPDVLLPNGLNINRFAALHEFQNLHQDYKKRIHQFTMGHFFPSYTFDLDNTLYFYTSGRYEYRNKGMDLTIEALARLNHRLKEAGSPVNVIFFLITRAPIHSINVHTLQSRAMLEEFRTTADHIKEEIGDRLFEAAAQGHIPDFNTLTEDYFRLRLRRAIHAWKSEALPSVVTHDLIEDHSDDVLCQLRSCNLVNHQHDPVKFIYHPDFINATNPLFGIDYDQFVRGCHLGVFPSYYEPWGYTPLESIALGVPAITSDLSGFGSYLAQLLPDHDEKGIGVVSRRYHDFEYAANQLADMMFKYCQLSRRERISLRNTVESFSEHFDWHNLGRRYHEAHELALDRFHA